MDRFSNYTVVVDDSLNGINDSFVVDGAKEINVSPVVFSLLRDSESRANTLDQICRMNPDLGKKS